MEIIADTTEFWLEGSAIAIGKFDGIHKGHTALLSHILKQKENGQKAVVFTFYPSASVFFGGGSTAEITTRQEKRKLFEKLGIEIAYTRTGIIIAMVFIGIPFVVRAIQPVLEKLPATYEEAAGMLGASRLTIFWKVIFPEIRPALLTGFGLALARGIGEYGSVIYISGNSEKNGTQVVSYVIMQKLNSGNVDYEGAAAIALVLLILSFVMLFAINFIQHIASRRTNV